MIDYDNGALQARSFIEKSKMAWKFEDDKRFWSKKVKRMKWIMHHLSINVSIKIKIIIDWETSNPKLL